MCEPSYHITLLLTLADPSPYLTGFSRFGSEPPPLSRTCEFPSRPNMRHILVCFLAFLLFFSKKYVLKVTILLSHMGLTPPTMSHAFLTPAAHPPSSD